MRLFENYGSAGSLHGLGIDLLVVIGRARKRHKNGRPARRRDLSHGARARPAQNQIGPREIAGHVLNERGDFCVNARMLVGRLGVCQIALAGLMNDAEVG